MYIQSDKTGSVPNFATTVTCAPTKLTLFKDFKFFFLVKGDPPLFEKGGAHMILKVNKRRERDICTHVMLASFLTEKSSERANNYEKKKPPKKRGIDKVNGKLRKIKN